MKKRILFLALLITCIFLSGCTLFTESISVPPIGSIPHQFDFEEIRANNFLVLSEPEPGKFQLLHVGKDCNSIGGGGSIVSSEEVDLSSFVNKPITLEKFSVSDENNELQISVSEVRVDETFYTQVNSNNERCAFVLDKLKQEGVILDQ